MTTMNGSLPVIGAALDIASLPQYVDWLVDKQRDLEIQDPCIEGVLDGDFGAAREARALLNRHGYSGRLGVHAAYSGLDLSCSDPLILDVISKRHQQSLAFGAELGATHMVLHSPFIWFGSPHTNYMPRSERQSIIDIAHRVLAPLMPTAETMRCAFVFEVCSDLHVAPLLDLVRSFESPYVRLSIDAGHARVMQEHGGPTPEQWVYDGADVLEHVHLQDVDGHADRHWTIGKGSINWYAFFKALRETSIHPRLILEIEDVFASAAWLAEQKLAQ